MEKHCGLLGMKILDYSFDECYGCFMGLILLVKCYNVSYYSFYSVNSSSIFLGKMNIANIEIY